MKDANIGIGWYKANQWDLLKSVVADPEAIEDTYLEWLEFAQSKLQELAIDGAEPFKVEIDVPEMVAWCKAKGLSLDGRGRARFIAHKQQQG